MGRWKSLGLLKLFLWYAPHLSGASILCFHILSFLGAHRGGVAAVWWLLDGRYSFPSWVPSGLTSSPSAVATITDDCASFVYWYGRQCSISQFHRWGNQSSEKVVDDRTRQSQNRLAATGLQSCTLGYNNSSCVSRALSMLDAEPSPLCNSPL